MQDIDLRKIVASKSARLARLIPSFVYRFLDRLLHIKECNYIIKTGWDLSPQEFVRFAFRELRVSFEMIGMENLDPKGRYIFAANHPFGGMDGMMIADCMITHFGDARAVVNDILMNIKPLAPLWIPVNTLGSQNAEYAKRFEEEFNGDLPILTFPAGVCSRVVDGKVADLKWKNTFIRRAHMASRTVVPLYVEGTLHKWFYRIYRLRKALGIKANLEMLLLVDGMFKQGGKHFRMIVGEPISLAELTAVGSVVEQVEHVRNKCYDLEHTLPQKSE